MVAKRVVEFVGVVLAMLVAVGVFVFCLWSFSSPFRPAPPSVIPTEESATNGGIASAAAKGSLGSVELRSGRQSDVSPDVRHACHTSDGLLCARKTESTDRSILFLGDLMFDRNVATRLKRLVHPADLFSSIVPFRDGEFGSIDAVVANLEGPVTAFRRAPEKSIDFAFATSVAPLLKQLGVDAVSQANNHALDQGREGAEESKDWLKQAGLVAFGDEVRDDAPSSLAFLSVKNEKIALVGFNVTDNPLDREDASASIAFAKAQVKTVVVFMHWGTEYRDHPDPSQVELAHWFIDQGVTAVIGAHPHWMQSIEVYQGHPIVYSLGNMVFDQDWSEETQFGLAVALELHDDAASHLRLFPLRIEASHPRPLLGTQKDARLAHLAAISDPSLREMILGGEVSFGMSP